MFGCRNSRGGCRVGCGTAGYSREGSSGLAVVNSQIGCVWVGLGFGSAAKGAVGSWVNNRRRGVGLGCGTAGASGCLVGFGLQRKWVRLILCTENRSVSRESLYDKDLVGLTIRSGDRYHWERSYTMSDYDLMRAPPGGHAGPQSLLPGVFLENTHDGNILFAYLPGVLGEKPLRGHIIVRTCGCS
ncbi:hypothetical protein Tco_0951522 [Tanacetum coccineum]|uniref:Uncharacterized protein n=1 Tax=Tanacetum coccineum TaxID=301880 RepID=A0ABQ5DUE5_9ASTR